MQSGPGVVQVPVFVYPTPITFYLDDQTSHKQVLTLYNPYEFAIRFRVLCTAPGKYTVVDPEGSIRPRCCIDIVVRHNAVSAANCNVTDKFRVQMQNHSTKQPIGKHDIPATLLPGRPGSGVGGGGPHDHEDFKRLPHGGGSPAHYQQQQQQFGFVRDPKAHGRGHPPSNHVAVAAGVVCILALLLPTRGEDDTVFPSYLHLAPNLKLVLSYVLGLVTMVVLRAA